MKLYWTIVFCLACGSPEDDGVDWENGETQLQGREAAKSAAQFTRTSTQIFAPIPAERKEPLLTTDFAAYVMLGSSRSYSGEVGCPDCQEPSEPGGGSEPSEPGGGSEPSEAGGGSEPSESSGGSGPSESSGGPGPSGPYGGFGVPGP